MFLLSSPVARGDTPRSKRRRVDGGDGEVKLSCNPNHRLLKCAQNPFSEIEYDDLQNHESSPGILLEMQDRQRYFEGQLGRVGGAGGGAEDSREMTDVQDAFKELLNGVNGWEGRFGQVSLCLHIGVPLIFIGTLVAKSREKIRRCGVVVYDTERRCAVGYQDEEMYVCRLNSIFRPSYSPYH